MPSMLIAKCTGEGNGKLITSVWVGRHREQAQVSVQDQAQEEREEREKAEFLGVGIEILKTKKNKTNQTKIYMLFAWEFKLYEQAEE